MIVMIKTKKVDNNNASNYNNDVLNDYRMQRFC